MAFARRAGWFLGGVSAVLALALAWLSHVPDPVRVAGRPARAPLPATSIFSLWALGDTGQSLPGLPFLEGQRSVARALVALDREQPGDALLLLGDNFYPSGLRSEELVPRIRANLVRPYCRFVDLSGARSAAVAGSCGVPAAERRAVPILAILGNHDWVHAESAALQREAVPEFVANWSAPTGLADVVDLGHGLSLVRLDSEMLKRSGAWGAVDEAIANAPGPWRIVAIHEPIASSERMENPLGPGVRAALDRVGVPVQLVLSGHQHNLQLGTVALDHPAFQVIAGGGSEARPFNGRELRDLMFGLETTGFARVELRRDAPGAGGLLVSLYSAPRFPLLFWRRPALASQWWVDQAGEAYEVERGADDS